MFKLGLIINPYAGIGGAVGLKGSDGDEIRNQAFARGAELRANERVQRCLSMLKPFANRLHIFCFAGEMGEAAAVHCGLFATQVGKAQNEISDSKDTATAVSALLDMGVDLILFAGGDGTARNIADALQENKRSQQLVLGIPCGVKMHSGVYANSPEAAGELLLSLLRNQLVNVQTAEVRDIDENAFRQGQVKTQYYGEMQVPCAPLFLQQTKTSGAYQDEMAKVDIAHYLIDHLLDDTLYIVGPGSTTFVFLEELGLAGTLLGMDVLLNKNLIAVDATAKQLLDLINAHTGNVSLIITAIGGQGHIIGRGNQQVSSELLKKIPRQHIHIIATKEKIHSLQGRPLLVDSNDPEVDRQFTGYESVLVGYNEFIAYPIGIVYEDSSLT